MEMLNLSNGKLHVANGLFHEVQMLCCDPWLLCAAGDCIWPRVSQRFIHAQCFQPARPSRCRRRSYIIWTGVSFPFLLALRSFSLLLRVTESRIYSYGEGGAILDRTGRQARKLGGTFGVMVL